MAPILFLPQNSLSGSGYSSVTMPPIRVAKLTTLRTSPTNTQPLYDTALKHGGRYSKSLRRGLPYYDTSIHRGSTLTLPAGLIERMKVVEDNSVGMSTRKNDESRVRAYFKFCGDLGIRSEDAFPAP